ncbi:MAG: PLP-dependent transferase [Gemmatimonadaceae bacterium]|nr:PLP-dependent transferase [Gemmatimonadaceae bacterium]
MAIAPDDIRICLEDHPAGAPGADSMATPIVQTSLFAFPNYDALLAAGAKENRNNVYTRGQNPTVEVLERKLAALEQGEACKAFGSGMAAVSAVIMGLLSAGDHRPGGSGCYRSFEAFGLPGSSRLTRSRNSNSAF